MWQLIAGFLIPTKKEIKQKIKTKAKAKVKKLITKKKRK